MRNSIKDNYYGSTTKSLDDRKIIHKPQKNAFENKNKKYQRKAKKLTQEQIEVFKQAFQIFDSDKSGTIDEEQLQSILSALGYECTPMMIHQIMQEVDTDNSGQIQLDEFINFMSKHMLDTQNLKKQMTKVFDYYDDDKSGFLDEKKIKKMINECFFSIEDEAIQKMIEAADTDGNHKINKYQFLRLMKKIKLL